MNIDESRERWAPELLDLEILVCACYLEPQFNYVRRGEDEPRYAVDVPYIGPRWQIRNLEQLLRLEQVRERPLHRIVRTIIDVFRTDRAAMTVALLDRLAAEIAAELQRDLPAQPAATDEYQARVLALQEHPWLGEHARSIPKGWLPICERAVNVGVASIPAQELAVARTTILTERFGRLEWIVEPRNEKTRVLNLYASFATGPACMGCGRPGQREAPGKHRRILTLCSEHGQLRNTDDSAFQQALFPGTPPDVPNMKLG